MNPTCVTVLLPAMLEPQDMNQYQYIIIVP